jgi:hypothetical protein
VGPETLQVRGAGGVKGRRKEGGVQGEGRGE